MGVVPLAGDVDRNREVTGGKVVAVRSSPSRGTWIEIACAASGYGAGRVVPLAGDVDRNHEALIFIPRKNSRPPRGGRG